jgi:hypothetical protein
MHRLPESNTADHHQLASRFGTGSGWIRCPAAVAVAGGRGNDDLVRPAVEAAVNDFDVPSRHFADEVAAGAGASSVDVGGQSAVGVTSARSAPTRQPAVPPSRTSASPDGQSGQSDGRQGPVCSPPRWRRVQPAPDPDAPRPGPLTAARVRELEVLAWR